MPAYRLGGSESARAGASIFPPHGGWLPGSATGIAVSSSGLMATPMRHETLSIHSGCLALLPKDECWGFRAMSCLYEHERLFVMTAAIPASWQPILAEETEKPYYQKLQQFVAAERAQYTVFPPDKDVFSALELTPYERVNVLLLGQDPYHDDGQAHGLCFSVRPGVAPPPSLVNIFKELRSDVGFR